MTEIRFYHLLADTTAKAVPEILGKAVERGMHVLLKLPNAARVNFYDDWLWRYNAESFLPHGKDGDPLPDKQPIWVSTQDNTPNNAKMAFIIENADFPPLDKFDLVCLMFDSENDDRLQVARQKWAELKKQPEHALTYWKQQENGSWAKQDI